jgi:hypothetical protein
MSDNDQTVIFKLSEKERSHIDMTCTTSNTPTVSQIDSSLVIHL